MTYLAPGQLDGFEFLSPTIPALTVRGGTAARVAEGAGSKDAMTAQNAKFRLALGVYESPVCFWPTFEALLANGISLDAIGFVARQSVAARLAEAAEGLGPDSRKAAREFIGDRNALGTEKHQDGIVFCPNLLSLWRRGFAAPALWVGDPAYRHLPTLNASLSRPVERGAAIMSVEPERHQQLWDATRILLQTSSMPVRTLEYSPLPPQ